MVWLGRQAISTARRRARRRDHPARSRCGFTLIEVVAVSVIISALAALALPRYHDAVERAKVVRAIGDVRTLSIEIDAQDSLPPDLASIGRGGLLDPWGHPYVYYKFIFPEHGNTPPSGARKDRFLVPVNSTYDLYSIGSDGRTAVPFTAQASRDDVVRASDGAYTGLASKF